ncbi:MAG TPA: hypothetical protein VM056_07120, partial [Terriglobales bacterium]|nr:hypothetical protein [Terriglobales bacterium]
MKHILTLICMGVLTAGLAGCNKKDAETADAKPKPSAASQGAPAPVNPAFTGSVSGEIKFEGPAPKAVQIDMSQDPACVMGTQPNFSQAYAVKKGKLENVYVYIKEGLAEANYGVPSEPMILDQRGCKYVPHVAGAMVGQKIKILNSDSTMHNVHPDAQANSPWNITQTPKGEPLERSFNTPELMIKVMCN